VWRTGEMSADSGRSSLVNLKIGPAMCDTVIETEGKLEVISPLAIWTRANASF